MPPRIDVSSDLAASAARGAHDVGVAALIGGNLFARVAMHPALSEIDDESERGKVLNRSWQRYGRVNGAALAAIVVGWTGARLGDARPSQLTARERKLAVAKDGAVVAVAATGLAAMVEGIRFARTSPGGAVPVQSGDTPSADTSPKAARLKRILTTLGSLHLASAIGLAVVDGALSHAAHRRPPLRRLLR
jgi:uncharacterized membrane protein